MMSIINLEWLSKEAKEAELTITDSTYECIVFCHPCDFAKGDIIKEPLHAFILKDLMIADTHNYSISLIKEGGFSQRCIAKLISKQEGLVQVGEINILLDESLPADVIEGDFIEFTCLRLDLW